MPVTLTAVVTVSVSFGLPQSNWGLSIYIKEVPRKATAKNPI